MASRRSRNPYIAGNPIKTGEMFFGREDVLEYVRQHLAGRYQDNVIVLHGQKRTGKTSVLYQIMNRGLLGDLYVPVYIDLQGLIQPGLAGFLHDTAREICLTLDLRDPGREMFQADPGGYFRTVFLKETLDRLGDRHLLLMIDEYEVLERRVREGSLSEEIFPFLRHLMQHFDNLNFIFTGSHKLEELDPRYWSFMRNALYQKISFLDQGSAWRLVTKPAQGIMNYDPSAVTRILALTSGHPYFIQLICQELYNARESGPVTGQDVDAVLVKLADTAGIHLRSIWSDSTDAERAILAVIAASVDGPESVTAHRIARALGQDGDPALETGILETLDGLVLRDVLISGGERRYRMAVDLLRVWINETQDYNRIIWEYLEQPERARPIESPLPGGGLIPVEEVSTQYLDIRQMPPDVRIIQIGRHPSNVVVVNHPLASRYHAVIERVGARFRLRDLQSAHGTFVNGRRVGEDVWLQDKDEIQIAAVTLIFQDAGVVQPAEMSGIRLDAIHLEKRYSSRITILKELSLSIYPSEFVAIVGASGTGKTALLGALSGFNLANGPQSQVLVNGRNLYTHMDQYRTMIGYVPQGDIIHRELTVYQALDYAAQLRMADDTSSRERRRRIMEVIEELNLERYRDARITALSGGHRSRVSIGVELLTQPNLFFLDEVTSGLDPGGEREMMELLRQQADCGRTVVLVTHATRSVMLCDQVVFLTRGGYLAYYGPPNEALEYFERYRTPEDRRYKSGIEFDDIYHLLEKRGTPEEWVERFRHSQQYRTYIVERLQTLKDHKIARQPLPSVKEGRNGRVSAFRQFSILSRRNLRIIVQDRVARALMLLVAPLLALTDFVWGKQMFDIVEGSAAQVITMMFMMALVGVLAGSLGSVREIVKEENVYRRERAVVLGLVPYVMSKVWVGLILAAYQATIFVIAKKLFVDPQFLGDWGYPAMYLTVFLCTLSGYLIGLLISSVSRNQNMAFLLAVMVLVSQFLFAGALLPRNLILVGNIRIGEILSAAVPARWAFDSLVRISGVGEDVSADPCWQLPREDRNDLTQEDKERLGCRCMGTQMFEQCYFPGIRNPDIYDENTRAALASEPPVKPPTPTSYPTFTPYPTLTPFPTPGTHSDQESYTKNREQQGQEYQKLREEQGEEYRALTEIQFEQYQATVEQYGEDLRAWESDREKAVGGAEGMVDGIYTYYEPSLTADVGISWLALGGIAVVCLGLTLLSQKRKEVI